MLIIGLTGGIGSGKSTVSDLFTELGIPVIDTDKLAREVVQPHSPALAKIKERFGSPIITSDETLDRLALRQHIFQNSIDKIWLEQLLHPLIRQKMAEQIKRVSTPYCLLSIPLLFETTPNQLIQHILVIDSPEKMQLARTIARDQSNLETVNNIMKQQVSRKQRLQGADDVIYNDHGKNNLKIQVDRLHLKFLRISGN